MAMTYYVQLDNRKYLVTEDNHLVHISSWDTAIRDWLAAKVGVKLSEEHYAAIEFIRSAYEKRGQHPNPRVIAAELAARFGPEKGTLKNFYRLFPRGVKQAFSIAGLPMQGFCF